MMAKHVVFDNKVGLRSSRLAKDGLGLQSGIHLQRGSGHLIDDYLLVPQAQSDLPVATSSDHVDYRVLYSRYNIAVVILLGNM